MKITCPRCGANTNFVPSMQKCYCEYCGSLIEMNEFLKNNAINNQETLIYNENENELNTQYDEYSCVTCGARLLITDGSILTDCVYCGSKQLTKTKSTFYHKPVEIIPFRADRNYFINSCYDYMRKSKDLPIEEKNRKIWVTKGVYIPCKIERSLVESNFIIKISENPYAGYTCKHVTYKVVQNEEMLAIQDASVKFSDKILEKIENYNFTQMKEFNPAYLAGFIVENANEPEITVQTKAENKCIKKIEQEMLEIFERENGAVGYTNALSGSINFNSSKSNNILLPVWFAKVAGSSTEFMMNGQTGKLYCMTPYVNEKYKMEKTYKVYAKNTRVPGVLFTFLIMIILFGLPTLLVVGINFENLMYVLGFFGIVCVLIAVFWTLGCSDVKELESAPKKIPIATKKNIDCIKVWNRRIQQILKFGKNISNDLMKEIESNEISIYRNRKLITKRRSDIK